MLDLNTLGFSGSYLPDFPLAPQPKTPSLRKQPLLSLVRRGRAAGDELDGPEAAVVGGLVAALVQVDHFARRAYDMGFFKNAIKFELGKLVQQSDKLLAVYASQYDSATGDSANQMSGVLGQSAELLLNLSPRQVHSALTHMHEMAENNLEYVPEPVSKRGLLPIPDGWRLVAVESPYAGDVERNLRYLRACLRDCLHRRETPLAAHGLLTQPGVVQDDNPAEQQLATEAGAVWTQYAQATVVYTDLGLTPAMKQAIARAEHEGRPVEYRRLEQWLSETDAPELGTTVELVQPEGLEKDEAA